jgi:hypothetical protein
VGPSQDPPEWDTDETSAEARLVALRFEDGCVALLVVKLRHHSQCLGLLVVEAMLAKYESQRQAGERNCAYNSQ